MLMDGGRPKDMTKSRSRFGISEFRRSVRNGHVLTHAINQHSNEQKRKRKQTQDDEKFVY